MSPTERLAKIAAIVEKANGRNPPYLDAAEMLGIYLLTIPTREGGADDD